MYRKYCGVTSMVLFLIFNMLSFYCENTQGNKNYSGKSQGKHREFCFPRWVLAISIYPNPLDYWNKWCIPPIWFYHFYYQDYIIVCYTTVILSCTSIHKCKDRISLNFEDLLYRYYYNGLKMKMKTFSHSSWILGIIFLRNYFFLCQKWKLYQLLWKQTFFKKLSSPLDSSNGKFYKGPASVLGPAGYFVF